MNEQIASATVSLVDRNLINRVLFDFSGSFAGRHHGTDFAAAKFSVYWAVGCDPTES
jgi:hypothetical protein